MGTSYSWHPGSNRVISKWGVAVPILPDEIFSSWLVRAALRLGCDPLVLTGVLWPKWRVWTIDVDRYIPNQRLKALSATSGIPENIFNAAMFRPMVRKICHESPPVMATWPWVLSLGKRNTKLRSGLQYCPGCLLEDTQPYFRIQWRFAWHTGCDKHDCRLHDRCWHCSAPVEPHRLLAQDKIVAICASCRADLRRASLQSWNGDAKSFQLETDRIVQGEDGSYLGKPIGCKEWFELANFFESFLRRVNCGTEEGLLRFMDELGIELPDHVPMIAGAGIEWLNVRSRESLLATVWRILATNQAQLLSALENADLSRQSLCVGKRVVPAILSDVLANLPDRSMTRAKASKIRLSGPRPRYEVVRMMARLERKLSSTKYG